MDMKPSVLPDKLPGERVAVYFQLATAIGTSTISNTPVFTSDPAGLTFTGETLLDGDRTAAAMCEGGLAGVDYVVSAVCALSTGEIVQPVVALPVIAPIRETSLSRPVIL